MSEELQLNEYEQLLAAALDDRLTEEEQQRLAQMLTENPDALNLYVEQLTLHAMLYWEHKPPLGAEKPLSGSKVPVSSAPEYDLPYEKPRSKVLIETSPPTPIPWYSVNSPIGLPLISYSLGAIITLIAIGIGAVVQITHSYEIAGKAATSVEDSGSSGGGLAGALATAEKAKPKKEEAPVVGHISGMVGCRWADPAFKPLAPRIRQGTKFAFESGLMEITYTTGAKVILQGPCTYEVESPSGGYLALGKLTAKVVSGQQPAAKNQKSEIINHKSHSPLATSHSPLFTVRTPTALITDLGTEFGVEVFDTGESHAHVFQGEVEVRLVADKISSAVGKGTDGGRRLVVLGTNQSAVVKEGRIQTIDEANAVAGKDHRVADAAGAFVRQMPRWTPIKVFNTGIGLKEGDPDPHWQLVARSDEPSFQACPAVVTVSHIYWMPNNPQQSQWISIGGDLPEVPDGVTFTFRTTFQLEGLVPGSAVLQGRFLVDNQVTAIRLNGESLPVPQHPYESFRRFVDFRITRGFKEGTNTLEIDVFNGRETVQAGELTNMGLCVELQGRALLAGNSSTSQQNKVKPTPVKNF